jgi:hypothetical protein
MPILKLRLSAIYVAFAYAVAFAAPAAQADVFNDRATWTNAVLFKPTTLTFDNVDPGGATDFGTHHTEAGVNFAISGGENAGSINGVPPGLENVFKAGQFYGSGYLEWQSAQATNTLVITLPTPVHAIGFDFAELRGAADTFTIEIGSDTFTVDTSTAGAVFFGVLDTETFTTIRITDLEVNGGGVFPTMDNFSVVPEPGSLLLTAGGAVMLGLRRRPKPA